MNKTILTVALAASLFTSAHAQTSNLTVQGTMDYESQYIFRGKKITNSAFQPSVNASYAIGGGSINGYVWTSQPIGRAAANTNEIDAGLAYTHTLTGISDDITGEIGYQLYWYPDSGGNNTVAASTHELHVGVTYDSTKLIGYNLSPMLFYYHDLILDSNTLQTGVSYSWDVSDSVGVKGVSVNPSATLGYTEIGRAFGDAAIPAGVGNWKNSYWFYQLNVEVDYKFNPTTTAFLGVHYAGNTDGTNGGIFGTNPQAPGSANSIWFGLGVKFNM